MSEVKTQPTKLVLDTEEAYQQELERELTILVYKECMKSGKMERTPVMEAKLKAEAISNVRLRCRVKGTRGGHINNCPPKSLAKLDAIKDQLKDLQSWDSKIQQGENKGNDCKVYADIIIKEVK